ncbi:hypothetical protein B0H63DRAFT_483734 [Podospora didyma]|uniref:5'-3' DNA helicase ZGRF1-like N-terminal domain-containing protein n=1 Tax=Podospora didyma TaxID=330526 RepID=A0AAE0K8V3_9PEZI|nr:hypothetical protein B0H63DRAFT_483734 [Podospora didyma]
MPPLLSSASAPGAGSTAPVLEFQCLFTHDLRRKQKRWQDGRLKYHMFNKRVMAYDDRGNFVGDMHWRRDWDFDEGEEVELERGGVIVQVAECVGRHEQDLSELLDKPAREKEERQAAKAAARPAAPLSMHPLHTPAPRPRPPMNQDHFQTRHRPLLQVLGTPASPYGRAAVPADSPFEQRQKASETPGGDPGSQPSKRRKYNDAPSKMGYAQSLFGTPLVLSGAPMSSAPPRRTLALTSHLSHVTSLPPEDSQQASEPLVVPRPVVSHMDQALVSPGGAKAASLLRTRPEPDYPLPQVSRHFVQQGRDTLKGPNRRLESSKAAQEAGGSSGHGADTNDDASDKKSTLPTGPSKTSKKAPMLPKRHAAAPIVKDRAHHSRPEKERSVPDVAPANHVIVIDKVGEDGHGGNGHSPDMHETDSIPSAAERAIPDAPKRSSKQPQERKKKAPSPPSLRPTDNTGPGDTTPEVIQTGADTKEQPKEPRTELRLKSRQKGRLLMALDPPRKAKRPKAQVKKRFRDSLRKSPRQPKTAPIVEPATGNGVGPKKNFSMSQDFDPFASSPFAPETVVTKQRPPQSPQQKNTRSDGGDDVDVNVDVDESTTGQFGVASPDQDQSRSLKISRSRDAKSIHDMTESSEDDVVSRHVSPKRKKTLPKTKNNAKKNQQSDPPKMETKGAKNASTPEPINLESDGSLERQPSPRKSTRKSDRQAHNARILEEDSWIARRQAAEAQESTDEEMPQVPVGPRLASLSRKSVRSKEVIGFMMSSSPIVNTPRIPEFAPEPAVEDDPVPAAKSIRRQAGLEFMVTSSPDIDDAADTSGMEPGLPNENDSVLAVKDAHTSSNAEKAATPAITEDPIPAMESEGGDGKCPSILPISQGVPALHRHNSLPEAGNKGGSKDETDNAPSHNRQPGRLGLVRHRSAVFGAEKGSGSVGIISAASPNTINSHVTGLRNSGPLRQEATSTITRNQAVGVGEALQPAGNIDDLQTTLHNLSNLPELQNHHPMKDVPNIERPSAVVASRPTTIPPDPIPATAAAFDPLPPPPPPKITNPATRGRKAALKSDAKGQTPQSFLPAEQPVNPVLGRLVVMRAPEPVVQPAAAVNERPKRQMTFPGFAYARGGGPWSREAFDLLETGRPP